MNNNVVRISLLGGSGSGKTSFMGGIVQSLVVNAGRYGTNSEPCNVMLKPLESVTADEDIFSDDYDPSALRIIQGAEVANELNQKYLITSNFKGTTPTGMISEFKFALEINGKESCRMIISDYAGELFSSYDTNRSEFPKLAEKLAESDVLIIMADGVAMSRYYRNGTLLQDNLSANIFNILFPSIVDAAKAKNKKMSVFIAITKSDSPRIKEQFKIDNFEDASQMLVDLAYNAIYTICQNYDWSFGVIPVTCVGEGKTEIGKNPNTGRDEDFDVIKNNADIKQKNIDLTILYSLYIHIEEMVNYLNRLYDKLDWECKLFHHPVNFKKAEWVARKNECRANIERLSYCQKILREHTFSNLSEIVHQRLPKNAIPVLLKE